MMTTPQATMSERIAALSDTDLSTRPAEVWAIALEAERAGVATGIVDALLDPKSSRRWCVSGHSPLSALLWFSTHPPRP